MTPEEAAALTRREEGPLHLSGGIELFVGGIPRPQGSRTAIRAKTGAIISREASDTLAVWRNDVAEAVRREVGGKPPSTAACYLDAEFLFPAPKVLAKQYVTTWAKGGLPAVWDRWETGATASGRLRKWNGPDLDKLIRAICDALVAGGSIVDDRQVYALHGRKMHALAQGQIVRPGVRIRTFTARA